jgi:hypothetical protein
MSENMRRNRTVSPDERSGKKATDDDRRKEQGGRY